jgi:tRNA(adenine34) deaminase
MFQSSGSAAPRRPSKTPPTDILVARLEGMTDAGRRASASGVMTFPLPPPMRRALDLAAVAAEAGEVPVGAVITRGDEVISEARNAMRGNLDPTAHAEMVAIRHAATRIGQPRLDGCTLWVTLEPCAMCAAAIALSRIEAVRFAAEDPKGGGVVHGARIFSQPTCHHRPDVLGGIGEQEAAEQLRRFFAVRRDSR